MTETDFETLDDYTAEELRQIRVNTEALGALQALYGKIQAQGVSRDIVVAIEAINGTPLNEDYPAQSFTVLPSELNKEIALEGLITAVIKATFKGVFNIFKFIARLLTFIIVSIGRFIARFFSKGEKEKTEKLNTYYNSIVTPAAEPPSRPKAKQINQAFDARKGVDKKFLIGILLLMKLKEGQSLDDLTQIGSEENEEAVAKFFNKEIEDIEKSYHAWLDKATWLGTHPDVPELINNLQKKTHDIAFRELVQKKNPNLLLEAKEPLNWAGIDLLENVTALEGKSAFEHIDLLKNEVERIRQERDKWLLTEMEKVASCSALLAEMAKIDVPEEPNLMSQFYTEAVAKTRQRAADPDVFLFTENVKSLEMADFEGDLEQEKKTLLATAASMDDVAKKLTEEPVQIIKTLKTEIRIQHYQGRGQMTEAENKKFDELDKALQADLSTAVNSLKHFVNTFAILRTGLISFVMDRKAGELASLKVVDEMKKLSNKIVLKDFKVVPPKS